MATESCRLDPQSGVSESSALSKIDDPVDGGTKAAHDKHTALLLKVLIYIICRRSLFAVQKCNCYETIQS